MTTNRHLIARKRRPDRITPDVVDAYKRALELNAWMADNRTISQLEAEGYPWIGCECCKGTVWVPFRMIRDCRTSAP
jgi:hypothetical protein